jgi:hypothetical protein
MLIQNPTLTKLVGPPPEGYAQLREGIVRDIQADRLILAAMNGEQPAIAAWMGEFTRYVGSIGPEIGRRAPLHQSDVARAMGSPDAIELVEAHQLAMREAEGSHLMLWQSLAESLDVSLPPRTPAGPAMEQLLAVMRAYDNGGFYAALSGIETIAWALAELAFRSPIYGACDSRWFDVHLWRHEPTNEELYRWMAIRTHKVNLVSNPVGRFMTDARGTVRLFVAVARELWRMRTLVAA